MHAETGSGRSDALAPRPMAELLQCAPSAGTLLNCAAQPFDVLEGEVVFRQLDGCRGLYLVVSGQFQRRTVRLETRLTLGQAGAGDLVELAAALGDSPHTYTLTAITAGSLVLLPLDALNSTFQAHPPLRMRLLEELAREVSRGYEACRRARISSSRRKRPALIAE